MKTYTTQKHISKLSNKIVLSWFLLGISVILFLFAFNKINHFSFQKLGSFLNPVLLFLTGIFFNFSSRKNIKKIKGITLSIDETTLCYQSPIEEIHIDFKQSPVRVKKSLDHIELNYKDGDLKKVDLVPFILNYEENKELEKQIEVLNSNFKD